MSSAHPGVPLLSHRLPYEGRIPPPWPPPVDRIGKRMTGAAGYLLAHTEPNEQYPFPLTTGRTLCHFHTLTKTGCAPQLDEAAPEVWMG